MGIPAFKPLSSEYLVAARKAVAYTRKVLDIGAANKVAPWDFYGKVAAGMCAGTALGKGEMMSKVDTDMSALRAKRSDVGFKEYVDLMASWAQLYGCGNCGPHSAVAFVHLRDTLKVAPLDWYMYDNFKHAFVIVGRRDNTDAADLSTWNRDAALCDPWRGQGEAELVMPYAPMRFTGKKLHLLHRVG